MEFNQIHNVDCRYGMDELPDGCIDLLFADLPYEATQNPWDKIIPFEHLWPRFNRICKETAPMIFTGMQPFTSLLVASNIKNFKYEMIWKKNKASGFLNAKKQPLRIHENIVVFYRKQPKYAPQMLQGQPPVHNYNKTVVSSNYGKQVPVTGGGSTERYPTTVLDIPVLNNDSPDRIHPNQKPEGLIEWFLKTYTRENDVVLDPTCGSGASLRAAKKLGRQFIGFEEDAEMSQKAAQRLNAN